MNLDNIMGYLIQKRKIVLGIVIGIIAMSVGAGYLYQQNQEKQQEALVLFDDVWQRITSVANDIQQQPGMSYANNPDADRIKEFFNEGMIDLDILISDYPDTISAARASVLYASIIDAEPLLTLVQDQDLLERMTKSSYLDIVKKHNKSFWSTALFVVNAIKAEQKLDTANALEFYKQALKKDKQQYLSDYILYSLARLYENLNDAEQAKNTYQQLIEEFPDSVWVNFAQAKIYLLSQ